MGTSGAALVERVAATSMLALRNIPSLHHALCSAHFPWPIHLRLLALRPTHPIVRLFTALS